MSPRWVACDRSAQWIVSFIALIGLMNGSLLGQKEPLEDTEDFRERVVLLTSGRILTGHVTRNAVGYLVDQNSGKIQLSTDEVKFVVESLHEGYCKQRDSIVEPTPATHLALANWCISFQLYDDANDELKKCLKADPENLAARRLLQRLTDILRAKLPPIAEKPLPKKTIEGFIQPQVESLGGLSTETALQFVRRIQPLMLHKCGNASCHGMASSQEFRVTSSRVSGHGSRQTAERNLSETFRQIDFDDVSKSKLLSVLNGAHGGKGTIFAGQNATAQVASLQTWVRTVVQEKQAEAEALERRTRLVDLRNSKKSHKNIKTATSKAKDSAIQQVSLNQEVEAENEDEQPEKTNQSSPKELKPDPTDAAALAREPDDAFDPERFNRRSRRP